MVSASLYNTDCVSLDSDGTILISRGDWTSPTTVNFIDAVLPSKFGSVYLRRRKVIYKSRGGKEYEVPREGLYLQASPNWEEADVKLNQDAVNTVNFEYKADRKVMNKIRAHYAGFLSTIDVMSVMSDEYTVSEYAEYFPNIALQMVDEENEHNESQRKRAEEAKKNAGSYHYPYEFNRVWAIRAILERTGLPRMTFISDLANTVKAYNDSPPDSPHNNWKKDTLNTFTNKQLPQYMEALGEALSDDVQTIRKLILKIVANGTNYSATRGYSSDTPMKVIPSAFGDVEVPDVYFNVNKGQIENYFIDLIKYVYADKIFKKVEVPNGVMPSMTNEKYVVVNNFLVKNTDIVTSRHVVL
jgi:hypothetical protein